MRAIAEAFCVSEFLLARLNGLQSQPFVGQVLEIPTPRGNAYTVKKGDTKTLLCGGEEQFAYKNGTDIVYLGMRVIL